MKPLIGILVLILILGCVSTPVNDIPPANVPNDPPAVEPPPVITIPEEPPITDVDFQVVKEDGEIHIQSDGEKDLVYDSEKVCENGVCLLNMQYSLNVPDLTAHIHSTDYNMLNKSDFSLAKSPLLRLPLPKNR